MISSNKSVGRAAHQGKSSLHNSLAQNASTIDNMKVRNQMRRMQRANATGNSKSVANAVASSGMGNAVKPIQKNPVVRNRTARDFA